MTLPDASRRYLSWARNPLGRIVASFVSWALFTFCMLLLLQSFFDLMAIGGSCATGSPYVVETECPDAVALFMPLSIFGGLASVALAVFFTQGFGTSLVDLAWPILFGSLGAGFLLSGDVTGIVIGVMFEVMALVPLVLGLRASAQRVFLGSVNVRGDRFYEGESPRYSPIGFRPADTDSAAQATLTDWALSFAVLLAAVALGYYASVEAYTSV